MNESIDLKDHGIPISQTVRNPLLKFMVAGVFLINMLAGGIVWISLQNSKNRYEAEASVNAQNITSVLNENISNIFEKVDLSLQSVCDEAGRQLAGGNIQKDELDQFIVRLHSRLPELIAFRATDAAGHAIYGPTAKAATTTSLAHRDYFKFLQDNPNSGMVSSEPLIGGISGKWMIILARRIDGPDGAFAGLAYAGLGLDYLAQCFKDLNVGINGSITLLDRSLSVLVRFPDPASNGKPTDRKVVFPALFERILRSHISATFTAISPIDDVERIFSYQTLSHYLQYYIVSGLSPMDYLAGWHSEVFKMSLFAAGFCISTLIFAWLLHLGWMKTRRSEIAAERSLRALNESLEDMVQERTQSAENANKILQAVIDCMSDWVWEIDNERRYTYCSPQVIKSMGYSPVDMIGKTPFDFMIDDEAQRIKSAFEDAFRQQSLIRGLERRCIAKAGNAVLFITNAVPILDENGCVTGYRGVETDLTDHRHAENAVRQQREFLETLMETIPNPIFYKDIDGRYTGCNRAFETFSGRPRQEIIGKTVYDLGPKELADKYFQKDRELYDHPGQQQYEWLFQRKDGEIRNVIFDEATLLDRNGHLQGLIGVISDITERKQAEKALIESESKYRQLFEVESDALFLIEADTLKILDVNPSAEKMYGYSREEFLTMRSVDVSAETNETSRAVREKLDRVPIRWHRKKDGTVFPVEISGTFFVLGDKSVHLPAIRDISLRMQAEAERLQLEQQLQQAKKAESLSTMAGAIAHNFNNILAAVIGNLEIAADEASQGSELHECITEALSSSLRAAELTRIMLTYLGHTDGKQKPVDVADAVREAISVIGPSIQRNIHLNTDIPSHGPTITADNILFVQILTNVLSNAVEAIGTQKGEITLIIDTLPQTTLQNEMFFPPGWQPNHQAYVCIVIADTGPGIVPENIEKIFDPFFSTKFLGRGLGLSMVAGLIRSMDGGISVISKPGWGTSFKLFFPITKHPNEK